MGFNRVHIRRQKRCNSISFLRSAGIVIRRCATDFKQRADWPILNTKLVGGPGFEPGASRSRTLRRSCPPVSCRVRQCPPVPDFVRRRVRWCPPVTSWFRECVTTSVTRLSHRPVRCRRRDRSPRPRDQRVLADSHERVRTPMPSPISWGRFCPELGTDGSHTHMEDARATNSVSVLLESHAPSFEVIFRLARASNGLV